MLINTNRIADSSLIIKDLDLFSSDQVHTIEMEINHNETTKDGFNNRHDEMADWAEKRRFSHNKDLQRIKKLLKMLGMSMAIFGIFRLEYFHGRQSEGTTETKRRPIIYTLHSIYCYIVLLLLCSNFARAILSFIIGENTDVGFALKIIMATWTLQLAINAIIMVKATHPRWGNLARACQTWDTKVLSLMDSLDVNLNVDKTKRYLLVICIVGWVSILFNICLLPAFMFGNNSAFAETMAMNSLSPIPVTTTSKTVMCVLMTFMTVAWIVPFLFLMALCFVIRSAFKVCKLALSKTVDYGRETNTYPCCLYRQRMLHLNISQCLEQMDKEFQFLYANLFFTNIPLACFILYELLKSDLDAFSIAAFCFWLASNIIFVTMATLTGAAVNNAAHSPLDCLYEVGTNGITLEQLGQLNLFTAKLNGSAIGFTVMRFVPVTKELFLTVGGLYLTYFFVLLQF